MITLSTFRAEMQAIKASIPGIAHLIQCVTEDQATARLRDLPDPCMVYTIPSYQQKGDSANPSESYVSMIWILEKPGKDDTEQEEHDLYEKLEELIIAVKEHIRENQEDGCAIWDRLDVGSLTIDPVYNEFGGFNGWMMMILF